MYKKIGIFSLVITFIPIIGSAEEPSGSHTSAEWQIWAYTSAAPDFIGDFATVMGADGSVIREGSNGWRCEAFIPMPEGGFKKPHDAAPACSDNNAVAWANAYKARTIPEMEGDGWIWMQIGLDG